MDQETCFADYAMLRHVATLAVPRVGSTQLCAGPSATTEQRGHKCALCVVTFLSLLERCHLQGEGRLDQLLEAEITTMSMQEADLAGVQGCRVPVSAPSSAWNTGSQPVCARHDGLGATT